MRRPGLNWSSLRPQIASARPLILCLDYDGTLVPLALHPSMATLPARTTRLIEQLRHQRGVWVALISGRALRDLKGVVAVNGIWYVGNHGLELEGHRLRYVHPVARASRPLLKRVARDLAAAVRQIPGAWVEDKRLTLSLHWRAVPWRARRRLWGPVALALASPLAHELIDVTRGKRVIEIRPPVCWGKGEVVAWLRRRAAASDPKARPLLVYVGDDLTDEEAFRVVNRSRGISIFVGRQHLRATAAKWWVRDARGVHETLTRILQERCKSTPVP